MGGIPLAALGVQTPTFADPLTKLLQLRQIAGMGVETQLKQGELQSQQNAQALQKLQIKEAQRQDQEREAFRQSFVANGGDIDKTVTDLAKNPVVSPTTLQQLQLHSLDLKTKMDAMSEADMKLHAAKVDNLRGLFQPVYDMAANTPPDQLEAAYQRLRAIGFASPKTYGLDDPQVAQQVPQHFPGKQMGDVIMASMTGTSNQIEQRLKVSQATEASNKAAQAAQETENLKAGLPKIQAESAAAPTDIALGQREKRATIAETQARTAQTSMLTSQMANLPDGLKGVSKSLIGPASAAAEKAGNDYLTAKQSADNMSDFLDEARSGNKTAVKIVPLQGALEITTAQGVHRINRTEVDQYGGGGDLYDRLAGKVGGVITGKSITDDVLNSMDALQQKIAQNSQTFYQNKLDLANKTYNSHFTPTFGTPRTRTSSGPPAGATHTAPGSDGKMHYTNARGQDLGVVQ